jgi:precorrin-6B methylase 2
VEEPQVAVEKWASVTRYLRWNDWLQLTHLYYATFVPGMQEVIAEILRQRLADVSIYKLLDGAVLFETECSYDRLNFFCFNNIFAVIDVLEQKGFTDKSNDIGHELLELHIKKILNAESGPRKLKARSIIGENSKKINSFRICFSLENKPVQVNKRLKQEAEKLITRLSSLQLSRSKPDTKFWFLYRSEGFSCFMKRLTNHRINEKTLHKGELSPQLAWLLCHIADLKHGETIIDPFCGYGAIPNVACKYFPIKKVYAADIDPECIKITKSKTALQTERCEIHKADFHEILKTIPGIENSIDAVISDPPWGMYKTGVSLQTLYNDMIEIFSKLLKENGRVVILSAAVRELESAVEKIPDLEIINTIPILVSGRKASVFVIAP